MLRRITTTGVAAAAVTLAVACSSSPSGPPAAGPDAAAAKFWETGAAVRWNDEATALAATTQVNVLRMYAYLSLAQFRAAEAAEAATQPHPPVSAAIGGASAAVLNAIFPAQTGAIAAALDEQRTAAPWPGDKHEDFAAGEAIGRAVGARVLAFMATDRIGLASPGTPPVGPGYWLSNGGPIVAGFLGGRGFFLTTGNELLPPPPPAFGSPAYNAALAEVRQISDTRTPEQIAIANFWNRNQSPFSNSVMNGAARELIQSHRLSDREAARVLFLSNGAVFDALIGCFNAKYHYWFIRPPQADPGIVTVFPTPPHPSYPSAHSCISGAMTAVLAAEFPDARDRLAAMAEEASLSRLYAGIHYRFDMQAGLALGRAAAAKALAANLDEVAVH